MHRLHRGMSGSARHRLGTGVASVCRINLWRQKMRATGKMFVSWQVAFTRTLESSSVHLREAPRVVSSAVDMPVVRKLQLA
jgi:hypothetical protein